MLWAALKEKWGGFGISVFRIKCAVLGELIVLCISVSIVLNSD